MPVIQPMAVGVFCGSKKPGSIEDFLRPFIDELIEILGRNIFINGHSLTVRLRCFNSPISFNMQELSSLNCFCHVMHTTISVYFSARQQLCQRLHTKNIGE